MKHVIPIYIKKDGKTERFQSIGHVEFECEPTDGDLISTALQQYVKDFNGGLSDEFKEQYLLIGEQVESFGNSKPQERPSSSGSSSGGFDNDGRWSYENGPMYIVRSNGHAICPMCWDGNFNVNAGTHKELTAEVNYCMGGNKYMYFALCREHQDTYKKAIGNKTFFGANGLFNKLKQILEDLESKPEDYVIEEKYKE